MHQHHTLMHCEEEFLPCSLMHCEEEFLPCSMVDAKSFLPNLAKLSSMWADLIADV